MNRRNKTLIICGIIWAVLGLLITVLGFILSGGDFVAWFSSKPAMFLYIFLVIYFLVILVWFVIPAIKERL